MKNNILIYILFLSTILISCDLKEDYVVEKTKVVEAAGDWYVLYNHSFYGEDPFGAGYTGIITYNTANDDVDSIWITDQGNFWDPQHYLSYLIKVPIDLNTFTFGSTDTIINNVDGYEIKVVIQNGIIVNDAVTDLPSGAITDSIYFEVYFEDLEDYTGIAGDTLFVSGYRRTGFQEDEP